MLKVTSTNFGANPEEIHIRAYQSDNFVILNGELSIDTTAEIYKRLFALELTVEGLKIENSYMTAVYVINGTEGSHDITLTKAYIKDGNTISIRPMRAYDAMGSYKLLFLCAFAQSGTSCIPRLTEAMTLTPAATAGEISGAECHIVQNEGWLLIALKLETIAFDQTEGVVRMSIPGIPDDIEASIPIIFTENQSSESGSRFYPATIQNRVMTILKDGNAEEASNASNKFTKAFILLNQ